MARDSFFGERIIWAGRPTAVLTPPLWRAAAGLLFVCAAVSTCFAVVVALALAESPAPLLMFGAWAVTLGLLAVHAPRWWLASVRYVVTDSHVIVQRGPLRRTVDRHALSFARVYWSKTHPDTGDLELVRAVPTGALWRTLTIRLHGIAQPARVWAIVRGADEVAPTGHGLLSQRLDVGERVLWSARPRASLRALLPGGLRAWSQLALASLVLGVIAVFVVRDVPLLRGLIAAGLPARSPSFVGLVIGQGLTVGLLAAVAGSILWAVLIAPARLARDTSYLVTDKRVLIQRGRQELHLDRKRIVDVIDAPTGGGLHDMFLVLDGPQSRAVAASGAFGESQRGPDLTPVFESVEDAEGLSRILSRESQPPLPKAA